MECVIHRLPFLSISAFNFSFQYTTRGVIPQGGGNSGYFAGGSDFDMSITTPATRIDNSDSSARASRIK